MKMEKPQFVKIKKPSSPILSSRFSEISTYESDEKKLGFEI